MHIHHLRLWFYPVIAVAVICEILWYLFVWKRSYPWQELLSSVGVFVLRIPAKLLRPLVVLPVGYLVWSHRLATIPLDTAWGLALLFLAVEFAYYWMHRSAHEIRWMWASHVVHHTPGHIHFASAFRLGGTEVFSGSWLFYLPLYWLGFHPLAVSGTLAINLAYQFWLHTDIVGRLGPLEWILNTPSHHRVHHASNPAYLDRNYGGILIIWDRLFGTFAAERCRTTIVYGLAQPIGSLNPLRIIFHEWLMMARDVARASSWQERWTQLFGPPGASLAASPLLSPRNAAAMAAE